MVLESLTGLGKGVRKLVFERDISGAVKAVAKGFSDDWALGLVSMVVPGMQVVALAQLGAVGLDLVGALDDDTRKGEARAFAAGAAPQPAR